jgi:hypothetical protein
MLPSGFGISRSIVRHSSPLLLNGQCHRLSSRHQTFSLSCVYATHQCRSR